MKSLFLAAGAFLLALLACAPPLAAQEKSPAVPAISLDQLRAARTRAAHRQRRILMNNDGNEPVFKAREVTREALLKPRTLGLAGTAVDTIFYASSHGFGIVTHESKVGTTWAYKGEGSRNLTPEFIQAGLDPLRVFRDFTRENGIELFWSFRVDDTHDAGRPPSFQNNPFKTAHPELLIGTPQDPALVRGSWSAVDYGQEPVREMAFRLSEEVCRNFDVDGIEWDFWRHTLYFRSTALRQKCTDAQRDQMTALIRRVRAMTETEGLRRGRPILLSIRVPDSVEYCRAIGIDLERWLAEDLADLLVTSGYTRMNPWEYSARLADKYGKPFYASLDDCRVKGDVQAAAARNSLPAKRARALEALRAGADGIYTFNWFNPNDPFWKEGGDPALLDRSDKTYFASFRGRGREYGLPYGPYTTIPVLTPADPLSLPPGQAVTIPVRLGDHLSTALPAPAATLALTFKTAAPPATVVHLNGAALAEATLEKTRILLPVDPALLKTGENLVTLAIPAGQKRASTLTDLSIDLRYPPK